MFAYVLFCCLLVKTIHGRAIEEFNYKLPLEHDGLVHHLEMNEDVDAWKTQIYEEQNGLARMTRAVPQSPVITADSEGKVVIGDRDGISGNPDHPCPEGYVKFGKFCFEDKPNSDYP